MVSESLLIVGYSLVFKKMTSNIVVLVGLLVARLEMQLFGTDLKDGAVTTFDKPNLPLKFVWISMLLSDQASKIFIRSSAMPSFLSPWTKVGNLCSKWLGKFVLLLVRLYQVGVSPMLGGACRFQPSCSEYAVQSLKNLPVLEAVKLIAIRLSKCRPGGPFGYDPVPSTCTECRGFHGTEAR